MPEDIWGYSGPIVALVGLDLNGSLTGVRVLYHREAIARILGDFFGYPPFMAQFEGKSIWDSFRVYRDVDGISRATISIDAMVRGVRNASRRVARTYYEVNDAEPVPWQPVDWRDLEAEGFVQHIRLMRGGSVALRLSLMAVTDAAVARSLVGIGTFGDVERALGNSSSDYQLMLLGLRGIYYNLYATERLSVQQGANTFDLNAEDFLYIGEPTEGEILGHVRFAGFLLLPQALDFSQPFKVTYLAEPDRTYSETFDPAYVRPAGTPSISRPSTTPSPSDSRHLLDTFDPAATVGVVAVLCLVWSAFVTKQQLPTWLALVASAAYLGFINGNFLSISHVLGAVQGAFAAHLQNHQLMLVGTFALITTLLYGRLFCGFVCPFGALQALIEKAVPEPWQRRVPERLHRSLAGLKYLVLFGLLASALAWADIVIYQYFEPFGTVFYRSGIDVLIAIAAVSLGAAVVVPRFYCRYVCPLGALLAIFASSPISRIRRVPACERCRVCERQCPTGAIRQARIDVRECVRCGICDANLIAKAGACGDRGEPRPAGTGGTGLITD